MIEAEDIDLPTGDVDVETANRDSFRLEDVIENHLKYVLKRTGGNRSEAARLLGVSLRYLQKNLARWREESNR